MHRTLSSSKPSVANMKKIHCSESASPGDLIKSEISSRAPAAFIATSAPKDLPLFYVTVKPLANQNRTVISDLLAKFTLVDFPHFP